jgi:polysaccharide deacetylase 2 family uncharacterized protein YibQ
MAAKKVNYKRFIWFLAAVILILTGLYVKFAPNSKPQIPPGHTIDKTGAGAIADFTEASKKIHGAVDAALKKDEFTISDSKEATKEVPRQSVEGTIRWHSRQLMVNIPSSISIENMKQNLTASIRSVGGQVLSSQPDTYQGVAVVRLDIGLKDKLAGEDITIISDRVYLFKDKNLVPEAGNKVENKTGGNAHGKMAIIIDDFGYNKETINAFTAISRPLTFAIIPYRPFSSEASAKGLSSGHQVILHLPMEPLSQGAESEELTVSVNMSDGEIQDMVRKAIQSVPGLIGVNNHQGSRATADRRVMKDVLDVVRAHNLFFVDSRTNSQSIAAEAARQMGVPTGENELFLDNTDEVNAVKGKLRTAGEMAVKHGTVTVIGHAHMNTAIAVSEMIPELEAKGIQLVFVSELLK